MKRVFISSFGITFLAAGSALAQYSYSAPNPYGERGGTFFPNTTAVVMLTPAQALERLRARVPDAAGAPEQGTIRFRTGPFHRAVTCGTVDPLYPDGMNAEPFARLACMASGELERLLLLDGTTLTAEQNCMLGLPDCPQPVARAAADPAPARSDQVAATAIAESRPR